MKAINLAVLFVVLLSSFSGLTNAAALSVINRNHSVRAELSGLGVAPINDERNLVSSNNGSFNQSVNVVQSFTTFDSVPVKGSLIADQSSTISTQGIHFNSHWDFVDENLNPFPGDISGFDGGVNVSTDMVVKFNIAEDTPFTMSWLSDGSGVAPRFFPLHANHLIRLTRNGSENLFWLSNNYLNQPDPSFVSGSFLGIDSSSPCSGPVPRSYCGIDFFSDTLSGILLSGDYTLELKNWENGRKFNLDHQVRPVFSDLRFDLVVVPLPASVWLFLSALSGLGLFRRLRHR